MPQASRGSLTIAGYYNIALAESARMQPTIVATQVLTGLLRQPDTDLLHCCLHCVAGTLRLQASMLQLIHGHRARDMSVAIAARCR